MNRWDDFNSNGSSSHRYGAGRDVFPSLIRCFVALSKVRALSDCSEPEPIPSIEVACRYSRPYRTDNERDPPGEVRSDSSSRRFDLGKGGKVLRYVETPKQCISCLIRFAKGGGSVTDANTRDAFAP
jgi:hypothetical protein